MRSRSAAATPNGLRGGEVKIHAITPGAFCVPSALQALTGADLQSVIYPALNRHAKRWGLLDVCAGEQMESAEGVLSELGYNCRMYRGEQLRAHVATWARRSAERWPGRALLIATRTHALVVQDGTVYDNHMPLGAPGAQHPFARTTVVWAALVESKQ